MYINLLIILFNVNLPLFALQLFDCEISGFWNPFYFILQNKYIIPAYFLYSFNHFSLLFQPLSLFFQPLFFTIPAFFFYYLVFYQNVIFLLVWDSIEKVK